MIQQSSSSDDAQQGAKVQAQSTSSGQVSEKPAYGPRPEGLRPERPNETAMREAYNEAVKSALESRDGTCGAIITASLSIITAYTAVITLVTPKTQQPLLTTLVPLGFLAAGFFCAAIGKLLGVQIGKVLNAGLTRVSQLDEFVTSVYSRKFRWALAAISLVAIGTVWAGYSLIQSYTHINRLADSTTVSVVYLNQQGTAIATTACGTPTSELTGTVSVTEGFVDVTLRDPAPCLGAPTVGLPVGAVGFIREDP